VGVEIPCTCGSFLGIHCGGRKNSGILTGNCLSNYAYECRATSNQAIVKMLCGSCAEGSKPGTDYCAVDLVP
jgi:hypothetical protein